MSNKLYDASGLVREDRWRRLDGSYHGSGCTLASAIAAQLLAKRHPVPEAVREARAPGARSPRIHSGAGQWLPNRFFVR